MKDSARECLSQGKPAILWRKRVNDLDSPVAMMLKLKQGEECSFLLESVMGGEQRGRYSIMAFAPDLVWRCFGEKAESSQGSLANDAFIALHEPALASLKRLIRDSQMELPPELPPMAAGLIGYLGYDMVRQMEHLPNRKPDVLNLPDACFLRPRLTVIHDSVAGVIFLTATIWPQDDIEAALAEAEVRLDAAEAKLAQPTSQSASPLPLGERDSSIFTSNHTPAQFHTAVETAKEYIRAGDIFQVVLSQRFAAPFTLPPFALYRALRHLNPSPFLFYLDFGGFSLIGSSPEILVRLRNGKITLRPIAGTRPRGKNPAEDAALATDLLQDEKELAEHLMLLDLGRNDVGRVAKAGSVRVTEQHIVERYSHVMHLVSNVEGELREGCDAVDALMAGFPAGTVSGAPKVRAMEIIDELEPEGRSYYAGGVGYFAADGSMDTCITLRTALVKDGRVYAQAGGGIVADSTAEGEYEESCNKARAVIRAAEMASAFA